MAYNENERQNENITDILSRLKKVTVPPNFDADLMRRINSEKYGKTKTWWQKLFAPSRLIPAAALALTTIALLFIFNPDAYDENPLLTNPRLREDVTLTPASQSNRSTTPTPNMGMSMEKDYPAASFAITKSGLNFRQLHLTPEEMAEIKELRLKLVTNLNESGRN
ncbi:MAG: hypothetical protein K8H86_07110 [Ignavibacteriaceae bacterium]|nr:hypothetical protein [Ignavibacteriaceae bacterium]